MRYFVTGIDTDVGKTVVSAVLTEALAADYWKPVQCGYPRDTETVASLVSNPHSKFHQEHWLLEEPASPHQAAAHQGLSLRLEDIKLPDYDTDLIIEGAGGLMVPLNQQELLLDIAKKFADQVILVVRLYLGCINHSLLTIEVLKQHGLTLGGIIFNGDRNEHSESVIIEKSGVRQWLHLEANSKINSQKISAWAQELKNNWQPV
ncbi:MAG: dethiobiotin synthase [Cyclobacteriaceae bacterium]|nr:dethiobiotin synthase [Cyclobacteriaceae bacterium]